jgi:hypothetical protein
MGSAVAANDSDEHESVEVKVERRGRKRVSGQDPAVELSRNSTHDSNNTSTALVVSRRKQEREGISRYLDDDYVAEELGRVYRAEDFHVTIKNEHDHEAKPLLVRMHPLMRSAMEDLIESKEFPVNTLQDLARVGIIELLRKLHHISARNKRDPNYQPTPNWITVIEAISRIEEKGEEMRCFQGTLDELERQVNSFMRLGDFGERQAVMQIARVRNIVKKMESTADGNGWGDWYMQQIESKWGMLLEKNKKRVKVLRGEQQE